MGRRMADGGEVPWGDEPPFHAPVFVVTHRARETLVREGGTSFTYVTGNEAIELTPTRVIDTPDVTHIRYRVGVRSVLGGDRPG
jgi:dihydrofolate reductase